MNVLKLLSKGIYSQHNDIFNLSATTGVFLTSLKIAKVIPIPKKNLNLTSSTTDLYRLHQI